MTLAYNNKSTSGARDGRTDRQTDRRTDGQSATQYVAPSYGGGRRITIDRIVTHNSVFILDPLLLKIL